MPSHNSAQVCLKMDLNPPKTGHGFIECDPKLNGNIYKLQKIYAEFNICKKTKLREFCEVHRQKMKTFMQFYVVTTALIQRNW